MKRLLLGAAVGVGLGVLPSAPVQAAGRSCPSYSSAAINYEVRNIRVGGTSCGGGRGVIANWAQNCSVGHCIVGRYSCHTRTISRSNHVHRLYCFARGRFVIATFLGP
jgi:hypothetical protein